MHFANKPHYTPVERRERLHADHFSQICIHTQNQVLFQPQGAEETVLYLMDYEKI